MNAAAWVSLAVGVLALLSATGAALRWLYVRVLRPMSLLAEDWAGEPSRPGVPARPGVMERLAQWEERQTAQDARLAAVELRVGVLEAPRGLVPRTDEVNSAPM